MDVIRKNLFLVVLVGVTAVLIGLIVFMNSSVSADVEKAVEQRDKLSSQLMRYARGQRYNPAVIDARRAEVTGSKQNLRSVIERSIEFNKRYRVLSLVRPDGKGVVPAFPFNRQLDREIALRAVFPDAYNKAIEAIEQSLNSTTPPTEPFTEVELRQWQLRELSEARAEWARKLKAGTIEPTEEVDGQLVSTEPVLTAEMAARARRKALTRRMVEHARKGEIYLDALALQRLIDPTQKRPLVETMWYAQLSLWLQQDVIDAIRQTNAEAFAGLPDTGRTVPNAAVKRLMEIRMIPQYVGATGGMSVPGGDRDRDRSGDGAMAAASLTEAVSNKDYDVIHYTVTVVLPFRYLGRLQWHLVQQNYHTVLDVQEVTPPADPPSTYYYGREPVVRVTLRGEWKLLTEWERPLMPVEVLKTLPTSARRSEDSDRISEVGGITGGSSSSGRPSRGGRPRFGEKR
jgi:hypothetical protein